MQSASSQSVKPSQSLSIASVQSDSVPPQSASAASKQLSISLSKPSSHVSKQSSSKSAQIVKPLDSVEEPGAKSQISPLVWVRSQLPMPSQYPCRGAR